MTDERPAFTHQRAAPRPDRPVQRPPAAAPRAVAVVVVAVVARRRSRRRSATPANAPEPGRPAATPFIIGEAPPRACRPATTAPELDDRPRRRHDLPADRPRRPADPPRGPARQGRLAQLLGVVVPAVPAGDADPARARRDVPGPRPRDRRRSASRRRRRPTSTAYAERYELDYTIGFDGSGHIFRDVQASSPCRPSSSSTRTASSQSSSTARSTRPARRPDRIDAAGAVPSDRVRR